MALFDATGKAAGKPILTQKVTNPPQVTVDNSMVRLTDKSVVDAFSDVDFNNGRILGDGIPATQLR